MKKNFLLFFILFVFGFLSQTGGNTSPKITGDFYYIHPQNTTTSGLIDIADNIISKSLVVDDKEVTCMAKNIFFEAAIESTAGKLAVAHVTLNRVDSKYFPSTVCEVVYEGPHYTGSNGTLYPVRDRCQFSWYCDGLLDEPREGKTWESAQELAKKVLVNHYDKALIDITDGATHYHANWMETYPKWSKKKKIMASIDRHIFYGSKNSL